MHLPALTDEELAHHAEQTFDPLTSTDIQQELLKRFHVLLEEAGAARDLESQLADVGFDMDATALRAAIEKANALDERVNGIALLDTLREHDIDDPDALKKILDRDTKVAAVMEDLAAPLASLQALFPD